MSYPGCACYWLEPLDMVRVTLRRFSFGLQAGEIPHPGHRCCAVEPDQESGYRYGCDASADLGVDMPLETRQDEHGWLTRAPVGEGVAPDRSDPRWPTACEKCGGEFLSDDEWQVNQIDLYRRVDTGEVVAFAGYSRSGDGVRFAGALFDPWWMYGLAGPVYARAIAQVDGAKQDLVGPDGLCLTAICPNGCAWNIDGPATGGGQWSRTGDPRRPETLTVSPSIVCGDYHGFLRDGHFTTG